MLRKEEKPRQLEEDRIITLNKQINDAVFKTIVVRHYRYRYYYYTY